MFTEEPYDYNININNNIDVNGDTDIKINNESTTMERYNNQNKVILNKNMQGSKGIIKQWPMNW